MNNTQRSKPQLKPRSPEMQSLINQTQQAQQTQERLTTAETLTLEIDRIARNTEASVNWMLEQTEKNRAETTALRQEVTEIGRSVRKSLENIYNALQKLNSPPSREEAPVILDILTRLEALEDDVDEVQDELWPRNSQN